MNKYERYNTIRTAVSRYGYDVSSFKQIPYGLQFTIIFKGSTFNMRIYESKKKGVTVDYSQVKNHKVQKAIEDMLEGTYKNECNELYKSDRMDVNLIGTDESGKGDYFGALCVSGVYANKTIKKKLIELGVKDCKELNDYEIVTLAKQIKAIEDISYYTLSLYPDELNKLVVNKDNNMNTVLAILHLNVVNHISGETNCKLALIDQFADDSLILDLDATRFKMGIELEQRPKAESNVVVAAASILARDAFLTSINELSNRVGITLPHGCGKTVIQKGRRLVDKFDPSILLECGKINFEGTTKSIIRDKALIIV